MPVSIPDLSQPLATLLAGDLASLDVDVVAPATPPPVPWGEQVRGTLQGLIQRVNGEVPLVLPDGSVPASAIDGIVYESDWSALASTGGNFVDGNVVLGDRTWVCANQALGALWRITNGTGLQWQGASGAAATIGFTVGAQTGALLYISLATLVGASFDPSNRYAVEVRYSGFVNANSCRLYVGFWNAVNSTARLAGRRQDGSPSPNTTSLRDGGSVSGATTPVGDLLGILADNSGAMHIFDGAWPTHDVVNSTFGAPAAGTAPITRDTRVVISSSYGRTAGVTAAWNISNIRVRKL